MLAVGLLPGVQVHHASMPSRFAGGRKACQRTARPGLALRSVENTEADASTGGLANALLMA